MKYIIFLPFLWSAQAIYIFTGRVLGLLVCAYGIFRIETGLRPPIIKDGDTVWLDRKFKDDWMDYWNNNSDGLCGDKRGEWYKIVKGNILGKWPMYRWSALRNGFYNGTVNSWASCDIRDCKFSWWGDFDVDDKPGKEGWHFVIARRKSMVYFGFTGWFKYKKGTRGCMIKLGNKIHPKHIKQKEPIDVKNKKGVTFYINPFQTGHNY